MDGDEIVFETSVRSNEEAPLFNQKRYSFIVDSTSNQGSFTGGQFQFNLNSFNSQGQWLDLKEAVVEFPIKITIKVAQAMVGAGATISGAFADVNSVIMKSGFHQWFDGAQMIINGSTIQSAQQFENIATTYRVLSSWSQDNLKKWGTTCGIALDDMTGDSTSVTTAGVDTIGLNNATAATVMTSARGFDAVNNQTTLGNRGVVARAKLNNSSMVTTTVPGAILGTSQMINAGISNVVGTTSAQANTVGTVLYTQFMMGTVRIRDLFDIEEFPLVKNLTGFVYLNYNGFSQTLTSNISATTTTTAGVASFTPQALNGRSCPFLINTSTNGITMASASVAATTVAQQLAVVGKIDGTSTDALGSSAPVLTQARLVCPFYVANPRVDAALSKRDHMFKTWEKIVNPIIVSAGQSVNYCITTGVPNPKKVVLLPMWQSLGSCTNTATPEYSPFDTVPATSGPYAYLNQLQLYLANVPIFQYPINYDFEEWNANISGEGANGNVLDEMTSGLLTQQLWQENHRFYSIDLQRHTEAEDGAPKSIYVSFTNPSATYGMKCIAIVFYEKRWTIDTDICKLTGHA